MMTISKIFKSTWTYIIGVFGVVLGLLFLERNKRQQAEYDLKTTQLNAKDAVDAYKQTEKQVEIEVTKKELQKVETNKTHIEELTPEQVKDYWNNKK